ncbi:MAG: purine-nucleoside phosphorylase [Firmicutes bacterium]|nr:purine-nucleoside phosphorylase [Bacillota bacterium]
MKEIKEEKLEFLAEFNDEPSVMAIPCDVPFIVDSSMAKKFNELKPNPELFKKIEEATKKLNIKVEIEPIRKEIYVLKKVR